jgi:hypothetical protein
MLRTGRKHHPNQNATVDLEELHSYIFIYSRFFGHPGYARISLNSLVGAGRFERPTPCAQGRCATRLRYAPTFYLYDSKILFRFAQLAPISPRSIIWFLTLMYRVASSADRLPRESQRIVWPRNSMTLEKLYLALMLFCRLSCFESAEVAALPCLSVFLFRIEPVFA